VTTYYLKSNTIINNQNQILEWLHQASKELQIPFLDYSDHPIILDILHIYNVTHLTKIEVERFWKSGGNLYWKIERHCTDSRKLKKISSLKFLLKTN
jgi:hypothetical protein